MKPGDTVTMYSPGSRVEHESWTRGVVRETLPDGTHIVTINGFKWDRFAPWGPYDGVPEVLGREMGIVDPGELEFVDTWPRRNERIA